MKNSTNPNINNGEDLGWALPVFFLIVAIISYLAY